MSSTYTVKKDFEYTATVKLSWVESFATNSQVAEKFVEAGFKNVRVTGSGSNRVAVGEWRDEPQTATIPPQVTNIKEAPIIPKPPVDEILPSRRGLRDDE